MKLLKHLVLTGLQQLQVHGQFIQGEKVLIIDAGSAVTYDFLIGKTWTGGNISPGLSMRFRALHKFTGKLPLVSTTEKYSSPGKNTFEAITAGVINGLIYEIDEYIRSFKEKYSDVNVILTGGDAGYLKERINYQVNFMPDIVIEGLNHILESNGTNCLTIYYFS